MITKTKNQFVRHAMGAFSVLLLMAFILTAISCSDDDNNTTPPESKNIVQLAQGSSNLSTLVVLLTKYPDLVTLLSGSSKYTVFAPTNEAFNTFLAAIGQNVNDVPEDVLKKVLQYHVVSGAVKSTQLTTGNVVSALGENIAVNVSSGVVLNTGTTVTTADVEASNGVVHIVDNVLIPPTILPVVGTIVAPAYFNKNFSTLTAAVVQAGLLSTLLDPTAEFTLFAPTNDAFAAAGINALPPNTTEGNATLTSILLYHVIEGVIMAADLPASANNAPLAIETLGGKFFLTNKGSGVFINGVTGVVATDIEGSNGVVHVIDRTLVPAAKTIKDIAIGYSTATTPEFTQLVAALVKVPALLNAAGSNDANLTVFAPTDAAFQALYSALGIANIDELEAAIGNDGLTKVLQHHIVNARVFSSDLVSGGVPTLSGINISVDLSTLKITDGKGSAPASGLVPALLNVNATNGVIHVIDKVLLPE